MSRQEAQEYRKTTEVDEAAANLAALGLKTEEIAALRQQGFVACEARAGRVIYKLRFRLRGRQRVRYLGTDPARADGVERLIQAIQSGRRFKKQLRELDHEVTEKLKNLKQRLSPFLDRAGLKFHGLAIRLPRARSPETTKPVIKQKET